MTPREPATGATGATGAGPALESRAPQRTTWIVVAALAAGKLALTAAFSGRYGFHRDELYYLASGRHPALGYVDYPPVTPLLARLAELVGGDSLVGLRLAPELAGAVIVVLAAMTARELGGGRFACVMAALLTATSSFLLGANLLFQTVTFEQLWSALALLLVAAALGRDRPRLWVPVGVVLGVGLETKYTILVLGASLAVGLLLSDARRHLRTPWPWLGLAAALVIWAPNLLWQLQHGWPTLEYLHNHQAGNRRDFPPPVFALEQLGAGPLAAPIWVGGAWLLLREARFRLLGWTALAVPILFLVTGGKAYYVGIAYPLLFAAGGAWIERVAGSPRLRGLAVAAATLDLVGLPIALPVLPTQAMAQTHLYAIRQDYADMVGWPELERQVAGVWRSLPPDQRAHAVILASNYGEAGAVDTLGRGDGLPSALSGHLTYWYWKPAHTDARVIIAIGFDRASLSRYCAGVAQAATITNASGVRNQEYGQPITICRPRASLDAVWPQLQRFR